jgi:TolA-binding protein
MNSFRNVFSIFSVYSFIALTILGFAAQADAQTRRNEREVRDTIRTLRSKIDDFQYNLTYRLDTNSADNDEVTEIEKNLRSLHGRINEFETNLDRKRENRDDVARILAAAQNVNDYLNQNQQTRRIETDWTSIRALLNRLAATYNAAGNWSDGNSNNPNDNRGSNNLPSNNSGNNSYSYSLNGTYQLDAARSENAREIVDASNISGEAERRDLEEKLDSPEQLAIDVRGTQVTLASSKAAPINFVADGQERTETVGGRTIRVRATLRGQQLIVSSIGGETDYNVTFAAIDNGRSLKVSRRITTEYLSQTVFADSIYNKTDQIARLGIGGKNQTGNLPQDNEDFSSSAPDDRANTGTGNNYPTNSPATSNRQRGDYIVPNGTIVTGILENDLTTKVSQNNDRFRLTVQAPNEFRGAIIEGYISGLTRSGQVSGRSQITFNFERITLRNGQTYDFSGFLQSVADETGKTVKIDTEGTARGDDQTKQTVTRGGIGAGLGAIIGAIAGGGKGAAIGAIIGGSAGAGSVIVQGRDDLELKKGSSISVQASSPVR